MARPILPKGEELAAVKASAAYLTVVNTGLLANHSSAQQFRPTYAFGTK